VACSWSKTYTFKVGRWTYITGGNIVLQSLVWSESKDLKLFLNSWLAGSFSCWWKVCGKYQVNRQKQTGKWGNRDFCCLFQFQRNKGNGKVPKGLYRVIFLVSGKETMEYWSLAKARNFIIGTGRHYFDIIWYLCSNDEGHFIYIYIYIYIYHIFISQLTHVSSN
jgi:hypothetical protein